MATLLNPAMLILESQIGDFMPAFQDLTGKIFGRLRVISRSKNNRQNKAQWLCQCECGNEKVINRNELKSGDAKSCGCLRKDLLRDDLIGQKFGKLTVISQADKRGKASCQFWNCLCECGNNHIVNSQHLKLGQVNNCGCLKEIDISKYKDKFFDLIDRTKECWIWKGRVAKKYGIFQANKLIKAHRFAFILYKGEIPEDKIICHTCDNPLCVNPDHLYAGTHKDNAQDRQQRGRGRKPKNVVRR